MLYQLSYESWSFQANGGEARRSASTRAVSGQDHGVHPDQDPWAPPVTSARRRWAQSWPWPVLGLCTFVSAVQLVRAGVRLVHFEPTGDALFTAYVARPQARAAGWALAVSALAVVLALVVLRRSPVRGPSVLAVLCLPVVAVLLLLGHRGSDARRQPEARMLAALRAVPTGAGWQQTSAPSLDPVDPPFPGELREPSARATFSMPQRDEAAACAELRSLLLPAGWTEHGQGRCFFLSPTTAHVGVSASLDLAPSGAVVTFRSGPETSG